MHTDGFSVSMKMWKEAAEGNRAHPPRCRSPQGISSPQGWNYNWEYYKPELVKRISPTTWELKDDKGHHFIFTKTSKIKFLF